MGQTVHYIRPTTDITKAHSITLPCNSCMYSCDKKAYHVSLQAAFV